MHLRVPVQDPGGVHRDLERGSILVETVFASLILLVFMFACVETVFLIADKVHLQRVVRDAAREAVITNNLSAGYRAGYDRAEMYFRDRGSVRLRLERRDSFESRTVVCTAEYTHRVFGNLLPQGKEVRLSATAVFGRQEPVD